MRKMSNYGRNLTGQQTAFFVTAYHVECDLHVFHSLQDQMTLIASDTV